MTDGRRLTEEEAQQIWVRAAELQAAAAEASSKRRALPSEATREAGYDLTQVRAAASDVGIAPEFVAVALAELEDRAGAGVAPADRWADRVAGSTDRALVVIRRIEAPAETVHGAMRRVLERHRFSLIEGFGDPHGES